MSDKNGGSLESMLKYMKEEKKRVRQREQDRLNAQTSSDLPRQKERSWEERMYVDAEKPGTLDNGTATLWYIIIMVVGAIFKDRLVIWVIATIVWWKHITRKARRQKEWDEKHNGGKK